MTLLIEELCQRVTELEAAGDRAREIRGVLCDRLESVENDLARFERQGDTPEDRHLVDRMGLLADECGRLRELMAVLNERLGGLELRTAAALEVLEKEREEPTAEQVRAWAGRLMGRINTALDDLAEEPDIPKSGGEIDIFADLPPGHDFWPGDPRSPGAAATSRHLGVLDAAVASFGKAIRNLQGRVQVIEDDGMVGPTLAIRCQELEDRVTALEDHLERAATPPGMKYVKGTRRIFRYPL